MNDSGTKIFSFLKDYPLVEAMLDNHSVDITYKDTGEVFRKARGNSIVTKKKRNYWLTKIPGYLEIHFPPAQAGNFKKFRSLDGFAICLDGYTSIDQYMRSHFNKKARGNILRSLRRLEKSLDITYERHYGDIEATYYSHLLEILRQMIVDRFKVRGDESATLALWDKITATLHGWILEKKASILVIAHRGEPICISVSYHNDTIFDYYITSFDISYSRFSLGNIMIYKQLEWCLENGGYRYFEMGWGDLDYKRRWTNRIHVYYHYLGMPPMPGKAWLRALRYGGLASLVAYLINKPVYGWYHKIKALFIKAPELLIPAGLTYTLAEADPAGVKRESLKPVAPELYGELQLQAVFNEFLYYSEDHYSEVRILHDPETATYYIAGKKRFMEIRTS